jgi:hypothetical protein
MKNLITITLLLAGFASYAQKTKTPDPLQAAIDSLVQQSADLLPASPLFKTDTVPCYIMLSERPTSLPVQTYVIQGFLVREVYKSPSMPKPQANDLMLLSSNKVAIDPKYLIWNYKY